MWWPELNNVSKKNQITPKFLSTDEEENNLKVIFFIDPKEAADTTDIPIMHTKYL